jgi:hypothetical protein
VEGEYAPPPPSSDPDNEEKYRGRNEGDGKHESEHGKDGANKKENDADDKMDNSESIEKGGEFDKEGYDEEIDELDSQDNNPGWENAERYVMRGE